jgi:hypothetical protein
MCYAGLSGREPNYLTDINCSVAPYINVALASDV